VTAASGSTAEPRSAAGQCDCRCHRLRSDDPRPHPGHLPAADRAGGHL